MPIGCLFVYFHPFWPDLAFSWEHFITGFPPIIFRTYLVIYSTNLVTYCYSYFTLTGIAQIISSNGLVFGKCQIRFKRVTMHKKATHRHKQYIIIISYLKNIYHMVGIYLLEFGHFGNPSLTLILGLLSN